jgi:hypothetical protein
VVAAGGGFVKAQGRASSQGQPPPFFWARMTVWSFIVPVEPSGILAFLISWSMSRSANPPFSIRTDSIRKVDVVSFRNISTSWA